jgi:N-acetylglucosamine kinase
MTRHILGIDGGGSRTRARIALRSGETVATGEAGPSGVSANGFDGAQRSILDATRAALKAAGLREADCDFGAVCMGLSGVDRPPEREVMLSWARAALSPAVEVVNDVELVLAAGTPARWGVALIAGTGSIGLGRAPDGRAVRAGGWGYRFGDEGSGYDLAREALRAASQAADGRGAPTRLLTDIMAFWDLTDPSGIIPKVYRSGLRPVDLAALAPLVTAAAQSGDDVAAAIVARAGASLAQIVLAVARALDFGSDPTPLALAGGLLLGGDGLREALMAALSGSGRTFAPIGEAREPVAGAVAIARSLLEGN